MIKKIRCLYALRSDMDNHGIFNNLKLYVLSMPIKHVVNVHFLFDLGYGWWVHPFLDRYVITNCKPNYNAAED